MTSRTLNLGILAHVDAGKTSLTERLLFDHGVVDTLGSVDAGSTRTDSGELERERGITIRSAVASFTRADVRINLIDTPGHPDFIAEVERALGVLDAAVLVLSAVEGVQAQTRVLARSLRRLGRPTLLFINKVDRAGARTQDLLSEVRTKLGADVVAMNAVHGVTTAPDASLDELHDLIVEQTAAGKLHPAYFGSAVTGAGVADLSDGLVTLLHPPRPRPGPPRGLVFAVDRASGGKAAYLRMFSGELHTRQRVRLRRPGAVVTARISALSVVGADEALRARTRELPTPGGGEVCPAGGGGSATTAGGGVLSAGGGGVLAAGEIGRVRGLDGVRVGDRIGDDVVEAAGQFSPPSLEALVRPARAGQEARLHAALTVLAEEDPLIGTRVAPDGSTSVLLYGAVQREVLAERLVREFGVEAVFGEIQPIYFERLCGPGAAEVAFDKRGGSDFWATVALRVEPGPDGSGLVYRHEDEWGALPRAFHAAVEESVRTTVRQGLCGWEVLDCTVTVTRTGWKSPVSTAADFRGLTPVVLLRALRAAGTRVCEPCQSIDLEIPGSTLSPVLARLAVLGAEVTGTVERGPSWAVSGRLPSRRVQDLTRTLPGLTHGEGALWTRPGHDRPLSGPAPERPRLDGNPLDREEYLRHLSRPR